MEYGPSFHQILDILGWRRISSTNGNQSNLSRGVFDDMSNLTNLLQQNEFKKPIYSYWLWPGSRNNHEIKIGWLSVEWLWANSSDQTPAGWEFPHMVG